MEVSSRQDHLGEGWSNSGTGTWMSELKKGQGWLGFKRHSVGWVYKLCWPIILRSEGESSLGSYPDFWLEQQGRTYQLVWFFKKNFIVIQLQLYAFSPHPSTPPQPNPPPSPTSTLPRDFVHVSFIVVPVIPSPHCFKELWSMPDRSKHAYNSIVLSLQVCWRVLEAVNNFPFSVPSLPHWVWEFTENSASKQINKKQTQNPSLCSPSPKMKYKPIWHQPQIRQSNSRQN